jgi:hypothetical protein
VRTYSAMSPRSWTRLGCCARSGPPGHAPIAPRAPDTTQPGCWRRRLGRNCKPGNR